MFKDCFKYYKSRNPPPDLAKVLDLHSTVCNEIKKTKRIKLVATNDLSELCFMGLKPVTSWEVFEILERPGLIYIKNPFTVLGQIYWTVRCLKDFSKKSNKSNIDLDQLDKEWWDLCQNENSSSIVKKLRWITLGYHHNWDTKVYSDDNRGPFPDDLKKMTEFFAEVLGYNEFSAEAAIINYYHMDSTLSGHTDHSERNLAAPLFSFSFGQSAIFLIGGKSITDQAFPMFLHSGDVIVMSKNSRLCYHGIPRIVNMKNFHLLSCSKSEVETSGLPDHLLAYCVDMSLWSPFSYYLSHSRININVRQVLYLGEKQLAKQINE